jgi:hypothetical protein
VLHIHIHECPVISPLPLLSSGFHSQTSPFGFPNNTSVRGLSTNEITPLTLSQTGSHLTTIPYTCVTPVSRIVLHIISSHGRRRKHRPSLVCNYCVSNMPVFELVTEQWLSYICLFSGRCLTAGLYAIILLLLFLHCDVSVIGL